MLYSFFRLFLQVWFYKYHSDLGENLRFHPVILTILQV